MSRSPEPSLMPPVGSKVTAFHRNRGYAATVVKLGKCHPYIAFRGPDGSELIKRATIVHPGHWPKWYRGTLAHLWRHQPSPSRRP